LWPVLPLYQAFVLLYLIGDAITLVSTDMATEQLGIAILYSGSLPAAAACWVLALRYAEAEGVPFQWAKGWWIRGPVAITLVAWAVMITNPWHGQFLTPVIGDDSVKNVAWSLLAPWGFAFVYGSVGLYCILARRAKDAIIRRNALVMSTALFVTLAFTFLSHNAPWLPFDLTVVGLGGASVLFLVGAYSSRLFSLVPLAVIEAARHDPSGLILVDLEGKWLRSNLSATKLLGDELKKPGRDVIALLARRLRGTDGETLHTDELVRDLLRGPRASKQVLGPLMAGENHWIEITATPIPQFEGQARAVSLRLQDVSERVAVEEQLRRARRELRIESNERRQVDRMLGDVIRHVDKAAAALEQVDCKSPRLGRIRDIAEQARQLTGVVIPKE
jgi:PAS domain S-box-containing protein